MGFTQKDLQNRLNEHFMKQVETTDGDATLCFLQAKGQMDNGLFVRYRVDDENRLCNLF